MLEKPVKREITFHHASCTGWRSAASSVVVNLTRLHFNEYVYSIIAIFP